MTDPEKIAELRILTEGYTGGWLVKVISEDGSKLYTVKKSDLLNAIVEVIKRVEDGEMVDSSTSMYKTLHWRKEAV